MHRCTFRPSPRRRAMACAFALALLVPAGACAQPVQRPFPAGALRGVIAFGQPPEVSLNGRPMRLAPGARIRGQNNMLAMSAALVGAAPAVHYTIDINGDVKDIWILTPDELARRPWPTTPDEAARWTFDPVAQTWSR